MDNQHIISSLLQVYNHTVDAVLTCESEDTSALLEVLRFIHNKIVEQKGS